MCFLNKLFKFKYRILVFCFSAVLIYLLAMTTYVSYYETGVVHPNVNRVIRNNKLILVPINDETVEPKNADNLFFIDTFRMQIEYKKKKSMVIGKRHACAFESAALLNPNLTTYVVYVTLEKKPKLKLTPELKALMEYSNLKFVSINHGSFPVNTPLGSFFIDNDDLIDSDYIVAHMSDAYRLLILWKYGGIYFDTDVISLKSVENTPNNFACDDGEGDVVANGIMRFDTRKGRKFTEMFMKYMTENYVPDEWGTNGPICITNVVSKICKTDSIQEMIEMGNCDGFHVLPKEICYPVSWTRWERIFSENHIEETMELMNNSMTLHLWNNLSKTRKIEFDDDSVFTRIAQDKCPMTLKAIID